MARRDERITPKQKGYLESLIIKLYEAHEKPEELDSPLAATLAAEGRWGITNCSKAAASERIEQAKALLAHAAAPVREAQSRQRPATAATVQRRRELSHSSRSEACYDLNPLDPMAERII